MKHKKFIGENSRSTTPFLIDFATEQKSRVSFAFLLVICNVTGEFLKERFALKVKGSFLKRLCPCRHSLPPVPKNNLEFKLLTCKLCMRSLCEEQKQAGKQNNEVLSFRHKFHLSVDLFPSHRLLDLTFIDEKLIRIEKQIRRLSSMRVFAWNSTSELWSNNLCINLILSRKEEQGWHYFKELKFWSSAKPCHIL